MMRRAEAKADAGDIAGALAAYAEVLDRSPRSARAHLDMALLLHDHSKDYVAAIYHYRRYIELRPGAEKADMIRDRIRVARQLLAGEVLRENRGLAEVPEERLEALQKDNDRLRQEIEELKRELAARRRPRNRATAQPGTDGP
jgi:tetratricopeptide (TPR) repeat protein